MLWMSQLDKAELQRQYITEDFLPPECIEFDARLSLLKGDFSSCLNLLSPLLDSNDGSSLSWELAIHALFKLDENHAARNASTCMCCLSSQLASVESSGLIV